MAKQRLAFITHHDFAGHDTGLSHPESTLRLEALEDHLRKTGFLREDNLFVPTAAEREDILAVHDEAYLYRLEEECLLGREWIGHPDNLICHSTYDVALLAAGAVLRGIELIEEGIAETPFALIRPPGHHALAAAPLGFCFLNNCAVACRFWQNKRGRRRVAIVDFDAHHGNGIESLFLHDSTVLYISIHEHPTFSFPGTGFAEDRGEGDGEGYTLNLPLIPGAGDAEAADLFIKRVIPALESFRPEAIIAAAGFDGHRDDPISGLNYSSSIYETFGQGLSRAAADLCEGRLLSILEGGYFLKSLAEGALFYCRGLSAR